MECDGKARPLWFVISEGQRGDSCFLESVLDGVRVPQAGRAPGRAGRGRPISRAGMTRLDKGYDGRSCRESLRRRGMRHMIPEKADTRRRRADKGRDGGRPARFEKAQYGRRNVIERCHLRLKKFRRVATRYEKRAAMFEAMVTLASIILWLR